MSDVSRAFLAFSWLLFAWAVFFHPLTFNIPYSCVKIRVTPIC